MACVNMACISDLNVEAGFWSLAFSRRKRFRDKATCRLTSDVYAMVSIPISVSIVYKPLFYDVLI
jgi:hypothetical protein